MGMLVCVAGDGMETSIGNGKFLLAGRLAGRIPRMYKMYHRKKLVYAGFPCCLRHRVLFQVRPRAKNSVDFFEKFSDEIALIDDVAVGQPLPLCTFCTYTLAAKRLY